MPFDLITSLTEKTPEWISACAAVVSMFGIWFVRQQLVMTKDRDPKNGTK